MSELRELRLKSNVNPVAELCPAGRKRASAATQFAALRTLAHDILREIFDESAYSRFLVRQQMSSCPTAYAAFMREQEGIKGRGPKCC